MIHRVNGKGTFVSALKGKRRQVILVVDRPLEEARHLHELVMGALLKAQDYGFSVLVSTSSQFRGFLEEALNCPSCQTGAILLRSREFCKEDIDFAEKHGIPCLLEGCERLKDRNWLAVDNEDAMRQIADHLHSSGRRRFGIFNVETPHPWSSFKERYKALRSRLAELGVQDKDILTVTLPSEADIGSQPYGMTSKFFSRKSHRPDAIVCVNDMIAVQVLKWLGDNSVKVPSDVAVTGFDDILAASYTSPSLSTVKQSYYEVGGEAVNLLRSMMDDFDNKRVQITRKLQLVIRESSSTGDGLSKHKTK